MAEGINKYLNVPQITAFERIGISALLNGVNIKYDHQLYNIKIVLCTGRGTEYKPQNPNDKVLVSRENHTKIGDFYVDEMEYLACRVYSTVELRVEFFRNQGTIKCIFQDSPPNLEPLIKILSNGKQTLTTPPHFEKQIRPQGEDVFRVLPTLHPEFSETNRKYLINRKIVFLTASIAFSLLGYGLHKKYIPFPSLQTIREIPLKLKTQLSRYLFAQDTKA